MRDQYSDETIAVEITVRHTHRDGTVERRHEVISKAPSDGRPQWVNRHIVAAVDTARAAVYDDFNVTAEDVALGRARDFRTARSDVARATRTGE